MTKGLNLGCGNTHWEKWTNLDLTPHEGVDVAGTLEAPLPFKDGAFEFVVARHVLEHIVNYSQLMQEVHRVLVPGGVFYAIVPAFPCGAAVADPTHVRFFVPQSFFHVTDMEMGYRTAGELTGLFDIAVLDVQPKPNPVQDRGVMASWNVEIHVELVKPENGNGGGREGGA